MEEHTFSVFYSWQSYIGGYANKSYIKDKKTTITRVVSGARHPYNSTGDLGWCDEKSISYLRV